MKDGGRPLKIPTLFLLYWNFGRTRRGFSRLSGECGLPAVVEPWPGGPRVLGKVPSSSEPVRKPAGGDRGRKALADRSLTHRDTGHRAAIQATENSAIRTEAFGVWDRADGG